MGSAADDLGQPELTGQVGKINNNQQSQTSKGRDWNTLEVVTTLNIEAFTIPKVTRYETRGSEATLKVDALVEAIYIQR